MVNPVILSFQIQGLVCGESVTPVVSPKIFGPILGDAIFDAKYSEKIRIRYTDSNIQCNIEFK
jgi:hypothetical protein